MDQFDKTFFEQFYTSTNKLVRFVTVKNLVSLDFKYFLNTASYHAWSKPKIFHNSVSSQNLLFWLNTRYFPFAAC